MTAQPPSHKKTSPAQINEKVVEKLAHILNDTGLTEIEYEIGDSRIRVAKMMTTAPMAAQAPVMVASPQPSPVPGLPTKEASGLSHEANFANHPGVIKAPMVGTVYLSPQPSAPPFIQEGDKVTEGATLLIIEAMKVMNPVKSPKTGTVKRILVQNGEPVEYDHPLVVIE